MNRSVLQVLDAFFLVFHAGFTLFNVVGWVFPRTRKAHRVTIVLTASSWFILGIWYGWGYCICTDWHWQVRRALGEPITSRSYIRFLIAEIIGVYIDPLLVERGTAVVFVILVGITIGLWVREHRRRYPEKC